MARLVEVSLGAHCTEWAWSFRASIVDFCGSIPSLKMIQGMGSIDSPTHTPEDCVEGDISTLELFAQFTVLLLCLVGVVLLLTFSLPLILRSAQFEGGVGGPFGLAGQGVTKIASGWLE
eukprot:150131-Pelagomonas_calceolata.AAC.1